MVNHSDVDLVSICVRVPVHSASDLDIAKIVDVPSL